MKLKSKKLNGLIFITRNARLKNPAGRACVVYNRLMNDGHYGQNRRAGWPESYPKMVLILARRVRPATATKWLKEYKRGGKLKAFGK
jgi:hypothetical protein